MSAIDHKNAWRAISEVALSHFFGYFSIALHQKVLKGRQAHGEIFVGDPIMHAEEEVFDLAFYLNAIKRERDGLHREIRRLEAALQRQGEEIERLRRQDT